VSPAYPQIKGLPSQFPQFAIEVCPRRILLGFRSRTRPLLDETDEAAQGWRERQKKEVEDHDTHNAPAGIVAVITLSQPSRGIFQNGWLIPVSRRSPVPASFLLSLRDVALETSVIPDDAENPGGGRSIRVLCLCQREAVRVESQMAEMHGDAEVHPGRVPLVPSVARRTIEVEGKRGGILLSIGEGRFMCQG
jgi:hypothetical protein